MMAPRTVLERPESSRATTDHAEIRRWAEERGGKPAEVAGTGTESEAGILRIDFPEYEGGDLRDITWDEFFQKFDEKNLAMVYQERTANGQTSRFCKFVDRSSVEG